MDSSVDCKFIGGPVDGDTYRCLPSTHIYSVAYWPRAYANPRSVEASAKLIYSRAVYRRTGETTFEFAFYERKKTVVVA